MEVLRFLIFDSSFGFCPGESESDVAYFLLSLPFGEALPLTFDTSSEEDEGFFFPSPFLCWMGLSTDSELYSFAFDYLVAFCFSCDESSEGKFFFPPGAPAFILFLLSLDLEEESLFLKESFF